jgi:5-hydroxyisourate hydrolase
MRISTHVLDTAHGRPAVDVRVVLRFGGELVAETTTNTDGRALLTENAGAGVYELVFSIGEYYGPSTDYLGDVVVQFRVTEAAGNYHVPLLVSPYGYSTYRGS